MESFYKITIPEPCHEDWQKMTPQEKGRFCDSCSKTVIDFTKLSQYDIHHFLEENRHKKLCGHFKQEQLDSIHLSIPNYILERERNFHKLFLLALLIVMGTSLLNCTNSNGDKQKIDSIEITQTHTDSIDEITMGSPRITKDGSLNHIVPPNCPIQKPNIEGDILVVGKLEVKKESSSPYSIYGVDTPAEFKNTPLHLSLDEKRDYFQKKISKFFQVNFLTTSGCIGLEGKQRITTRFIIDSLGKIKDIKVRAPHITLEKETLKTLKKLPQFTPAKLEGENVSMTYTLPIIFQVQD